MDRDGLEELFAPFAVVSVRRMFGGHGVYADGLCFALEIGGEVYLKVDAETESGVRRPRDRDPSSMRRAAAKSRVGVLAAARRRPTTTRTS